MPTLHTLLLRLIKLLSLPTGGTLVSRSIEEVLTVYALLAGPERPRRPAWDVLRGPNDGLVGSKDGARVSRTTRHIGRQRLAFVGGKVETVIFRTGHTGLRRLREQPTRIGTIHTAIARPEGFFLRAGNVVLGGSGEGLALAEDDVGVGGRIGAVLVASGVGGLDGLLGGLGWGGGLVRGGVGGGGSFVGGRGLIGRGGGFI